MASRDVVHYDTPVQRILRVLATIFVIFYLIWTLLPFVVMFVSSFKDLLEAFKLPAIGDWSGIGVFFDFTPTLKHYQTLFYENSFSDNLYIFFYDEASIWINYRGEIYIGNEQVEM
jgi:multiple sugar transport system permease protein